MLPNSTPVLWELTRPTHCPAGNSSGISVVQTGYFCTERTSRVSTPGYQTPLITNPSRKEFSVLAKTASVSYDTLQRNGILNQNGTPTKKYTPYSGKGSQIAVDDAEAEYPYDSPTKTWRLSKPSSGTTKEIQRKAEGVKALWVDDPDDARLQHFSPAKEKWKAL